MDEFKIAGAIAGAIATFDTFDEFIISGTIAIFDVFCDFCVIRDDLLRFPNAVSGSMFLLNEKKQIKIATATQTLLDALGQAPARQDN